MNLLRDKNLPDSASLIRGDFLAEETRKILKNAILQKVRAIFCNFIEGGEVSGQHRDSLIFI